MAEPVREAQYLAWLSLGGQKASTDLGAGPISLIVEKSRSRLSPNLALEEEKSLSSRRLEFRSSCRNTLPLIRLKSLRTFPSLTWELRRAPIVWLSIMRWAEKSWASFCYKPLLHRILYPYLFLRTYPPVTRKVAFHQPIDHYYLDINFLLLSSVTTTYFLVFPLYILK